MISKNKDIALDATEVKFPSTPISPHAHFGWNDKKDAYRHAYFNAINTKSVGRSAAKLFSDAHETETPQRWLKEKEMDLFNNAIGHSLGENNSNLSNFQLRDIVWNALLNGNLNYLLPINYNDPNFLDDPSTSEPRDGTHGISDITGQFSTDQ